MNVNKYQSVDTILFRTKEKNMKCTVIIVAMISMTLVIRDKRQVQSITRFDYIIQKNCVMAKDKDLLLVYTTNMYSNYWTVVLASVVNAFQFVAPHHLAIIIFA